MSLGALGIITEYTLKLEPAFSLRRRVWLEPVNELLEKSKSYLQYELRIFIFPVQVMPPGLHEIHSGPSQGTSGDEDEELLESLKQLRDVFGWFPWLRENYLRGVPVVW